MTNRRKPLMIIDTLAVLTKKAVVTLTFVLGSRKIVINMARFILHHMVRFGGDRMIPLGGVRGRTDRQTHTQTHRHTEGLTALII